MKPEYCREGEDDQPPPRKEEPLPLRARSDGDHPAADTIHSAEALGAGAADVSIEDDDLDWIQLDNGWRLVIWDEEEWVEMGLTPAGLSRIIDRLQAATTGQPPGNVTLSQGELESALTNQAVCWPQDSSQDPSKISLLSSRDPRSSS